ncbi:carbohydrate kinase [Mucilaginibacter rubeus]|uniref:Carbohydrate kinase n=1 Tax=Mucilaginibacter rubeus TaxID=2027860 RepID=A0AAE6MLE7_9SPHI|nr:MULTISPECIES: carbohydrate kinase [Mucilaginibacter]QEM07788.1 carbohydrate kinase [Mucilaginibacter rubeus]QEM20241.1 carbohydrate kinase [Mucilaginibacter gossypii]QTE43042.1 carbohydrate kinase [Mucilaginibacter rubeus]QTE49643.1 carbohydrate kinase [Mucilaginibacter rubeus]QTE54738.1 carbohydrate kinase [Mucilaginibacter rubeus]
MMNLHTNTLTPAICYGEILWDVLPDGPQPGGALLNVSYHLNKLGMPASLVSKIGNDADGQKLENLLDNWGIKKHLLQTDTEHPTSQVIAKMNNGNEVSYEIIFPVAWDFINDSEHIKTQIRPSTYFVFGSLASRNNVSRNTLFELLESDAIKVFDINLRPPFISRDLLADLLHKANIVKFNQAELEMVQGLFRGSFWKESEQIKFIQDHFNIPEIIVTKGEFGASYYKEEKAYHIAGREVKVSDTIGSGDSFLAAFIANHYRGESPEILLKNAIAMGGFIATKKGGCPDYKIKEYQDFINKMF